MILEEKLRALVKKFKDIEEKLSYIEPSSADYIQLSKEYRRMDPIVGVIDIILELTRQQDSANKVLLDEDFEIRNMAQDEIEQIKKKLETLHQELRILLLPKDQDDDRSVILEIRAGTGGEEAALFAGDLMRMYTRYSEYRGWSLEVMGSSETDLGGIKEVSLAIRGQGVFEKLKYEGGTHRVQRVPHTEASGRIHTSAATVAVLPEAEEHDIILLDKDLRIDVYRSSGPGGQSVNTTDSAVRITHLPTGIVVIQQDEKSQHKNKAKALRVLRARLYEAERQRKEAELAVSRQNQIGSGDRSERIRTYNFPQGRLTDHRIGLNLYKLDRIIEGEALEEVIHALRSYYQAELLAACGDSFDILESA
jgi:peptide chain release factor 1